MRAAHSSRSFSTSADEDGPPLTLAARLEREPPKEKLLTSRERLRPRRGPLLVAFATLRPTESIAEGYASSEPSCCGAARLLVERPRIFLNLHDAIRLQSAESEWQRDGVEMVW